MSWGAIAVGAGGSWRGSCVAVAGRVGGVCGRRGGRINIIKKKNNNNKMITAGIHTAPSGISEDFLQSIMGAGGIFPGVLKPPPLGFEGEEILPL